MPNIIIANISDKYLTNEKPKNKNVIIFIPCWNVIKVDWVPTVAFLSFLNDLTNGAINKPVPPTNIVKKDEINPSIPIFMFEILIFCALGTYKE